MSKNAPSRRPTGRPRGRPTAEIAASPGLSFVHTTGPAIAQAVADGSGLGAACAQFQGVTPAMFLRWVERHAPLRAAWDRAKAMRANGLFEDVVALAGELRDLAAKLKETKDSGPKRQCLVEAADLFKWAAARLDPNNFGDRAQPGSGVAIQINTSLPLRGATEIDDGADSWTLRVGPGPAPETRDDEGSGALPVKPAADPDPISTSISNAEWEAT